MLKTSKGSSHAFYRTKVRKALDMLSFMCHQTQFKEILKGTVGVKGNLFCASFHLGALHIIKKLYFVKPIAVVDKITACFSLSNRSIRGKTHSVKLHHAEQKLAPIFLGDCSFLLGEVLPEF